MHRDTGPAAVVAAELGLGNGPVIGFIGSFYDYEGIDDLINLVGVDQVLYGSDWPHPEGLAEPTHYVTALDHLSVEDQAKIMGGNLGRLVTV